MGKRIKQARKQIVNEHTSICNQNDIPISFIREGITVPPGGVVLMDKDITTASNNSQYYYESIVTVCTTNAKEYIIDTAKMSEFDLAYEGVSLVAVVGPGEGAKATAFDEDEGSGHHKTFAGTENKPTRMNSLLANKYAAMDKLLGNNVFSVKVESTTATLSDCEATVDADELRKHLSRLETEHKRHLHSWSAAEKMALKSARTKLEKGEHHWSKDEMAAYKKWQHFQRS